VGSSSTTSISPFHESDSFLAAAKPRSNCKTKIRYACQLFYGIKPMQRSAVISPGNSANWADWSERAEKTSRIPSM